MGTQSHGSRRLDSRVTRGGKIVKQQILFIVLVLLMVGLLTSTSALAHHLELMQPMELEDWLHSLFQSSENEVEPYVNLAYVYQNGNDNGSEQIQQGEDNRAYVYQNGDGNVAEQWQSGVGNWAGVYQLGNRNVAISHQMGTSNWAGIYQVGDTNTARIQQSGNNFSAFVTQIGNGNSAVIVQGSK